VFGDAAPAARVSHVPVPGATPPGTVVTAHDPASARKAIESAGATGAAIPLLRGRSAVDKAIAAFLVTEAAAVGLTLEVREVPSTGDVYRTRKHGGLLLHTTTGERDAPPEKYWGLPQPDGKFDRAFRSDAYDGTIAALVEREERALYPERRDQIRDQLFAAYSERLPFLPLLFLADRVATRAELDGWAAGTGANFGTTIEAWHFESAQAGSK
jgi:ABC-type transport system substrate-binding protein